MAVVFTLGGCASSASVQRRLGGAPAALAPVGARARFDPGAFDVVFRDALRALNARGFDIAASDPDLGAIATAPAELDAPCRGTSCLARETAAIKLGYRQARVTVTREVWDATLRAWRVADDAVSADAIAREERELVAAVMRERDAQ
jgi:hypothetical protein